MATDPPRRYAPVRATILAGDAPSQDAADLVARHSTVLRGAVAAFVAQLGRPAGDAALVFGDREGVARFIAGPLPPEPRVVCVILRTDLVPCVRAAGMPQIAAAVSEALATDAYPDYLPVLCCLPTGAGLVWLGRSGATAPGGVA